MGEEQLKQYRLRVASFTEKGLRKRNEDRYSESPIGQDSDLLLVADGMGGYEDGHLAAEIALDEITKYLAVSGTAPVNATIEEAFFRAHSSIKKQLSNSGATVGGIWITAQNIYVFWVGDVKIALRNGECTWVSRDHSLINLLKDAEVMIKPEEVIRLSSTVVRSLGGKSNSYLPEIVSFERCSFFQGIICSDGMLQFYSDLQLQDLVALQGSENLNNIALNPIFEQAVDNVTGLIFFSE